MSCFYVKFGISTCLVKQDFRTVRSLEFLFVRSNRISMSHVTVWCLESLLVRSNRISICLVIV